MNRAPKYTWCCEFELGKRKKLLLPKWFELCSKATRPKMSNGNGNYAIQVKIIRNNHNNDTAHQFRIYILCKLDWRVAKCVELQASTIIHINVTNTKPHYAFKSTRNCVCFWLFVKAFNLCSGYKSPAEQFKLIIVSLWNMGDIGHDSSFPRISSNIPYWPFQFIQPHIHVHNQINNAMLCAHLTLILYIYRSLSITLTRSRRSMRPMRHVHCLQLKCIS